MPMYKKKGGYGIKNVKGTSKTKKAAKKRMAAIQISKKKKKTKRGK